MDNAAVIYCEAFNAGLCPPPDFTVTQWADAHRYLPKQSSSEPGRYRSERVPYAREIMDSLSPECLVEEICVMKGTQLGLTEVGNNWLGYVADCDPGPMLMVFPSVDLAKDHSKQKLAPTIEDTPRLKDRIKENRSRDSGNTLMVKEFPGGVLFLAGSNSAAGFRSKSIRYLFLDDVDGYPYDVDGEGDPCALAKKRTDTFPNRKIYEVSTPTVKGFSRIEKSFEDSDQRYYHVPCPHCQEKQVLEFGGTGLDHGIKFDRDQAGNVTRVWYVCKICKQAIEEFHKTWMLENGEWIAKHPGRKRRGYHLSSLYSPLGWTSWQKVVEEFLEAKDNKERLKVWTNTRMGLPFEERGSQPDWSLLKAKCEPYPFMTVPLGGYILTAGVDVQDNRLACVIRAWGRGEESWLIYWGEIYGDPGQQAVWGQLDELLNRPYDHTGGAQIYIVSAAVDTGGHHTQDVYNFCRARSPRLIAIKGQSATGKPIIGRPTNQDVTWKGTTIKNGVQLWPIGSDTAKSTIYSRLKQTEPGPGRYHFPIGLDDDYFLQLTAEKLITRYNKGFPVMEWVKTGPRNEALDCEVYCYAAAIRAGISRINFDAIDLTPINRNEQQKEQKIMKAQPKVLVKSNWMNR